MKRNFDRFVSFWRCLVLFASGFLWRVPQKLKRIICMQDQVGRQMFLLFFFVFLYTRKFLLSVVDCVFVGLELKSRYLPGSTSTHLWLLLYLVLHRYLKHVLIPESRHSRGPIGWKNEKDHETTSGWKCPDASRATPPYCLLTLFTFSSHFQWKCL